MSQFLLLPQPSMLVQKAKQILEAANPNLNVQSGNCQYDSVSGYQLV